MANHRSARHFGNGGNFPRHHFFVALYFWSVYMSLASPVNVTVDDVHPSIIYKPPNSWHSSSQICTTCLNPDVKNAFLGTYHDGTNAPSSPIVSQTPAPGGGQVGGQEVENGDQEESGDSGKGRGKGKPGSDEHRSGSHRRAEVAGNDMTVEFQFDGTAVYVFCIQPLGVPLVNSAPTSMNLTFYIDNVQQGNFTHEGTGTTSGYLPGVNVFSKTNLTSKTHLLRVGVGPRTVFLFDYIVYTQIDEDLSEASPPVADSPTQSGGPDPSAKHRNIGTFVGAIVGSVGVLALISLGLAYSIMRRRWRYKRRERLESNSGRSTSSDVSPNNSAGPRLFVPRFFPGTHISADPPPYVESISTTSDIESHSFNGSAGATTAAAPAPAVSEVPSVEMRSLSFLTVPATYNAHLANVRDSYADVPPASPPPPLDDVLTPPPPFGAAVASGDELTTLSSRRSDGHAMTSEPESESDTRVTDPLIPHA